MGKGVLQLLRMINYACIRPEETVNLESSHMVAITEDTEGERRLTSKFPSRYAGQGAQIKTIEYFRDNIDCKKPKCAAHLRRCKVISNLLGIRAERLCLGKHCQTSKLCN